MYLHSLELLALSTMTNVHSAHAKTARNPFCKRSTTAKLCKTALLNFSSIEDIRDDKAFMNNSTHLYENKKILRRSVVFH